MSRTLESQATGEERSAEADVARARVVNVVNLVNSFFRDKLAAMPTIKEYIDSMQAE